MNIYKMDCKALLLGNCHAYVCMDFIGNQLS